MKTVITFFKAAPVVFVLVFAPIGSFLFLKYGFNYRLESLHQLEDKSIEPALTPIIDRLRSGSHTAKLIHVPGNQQDKELDLLYKIDERIVDRESFDIISFSNERLPNVQNKIKFIDDPSYSLAGLVHQFYLIDTLGKLRQYYDIASEDGKNMIRHLSVVIPMPKQKKIQLNRDVKQSE